MPGTIKVSVLELMDSSMSTSSPTASKTSSLSLKVALGKKYYQTKEGENLSLPVLSLRENLVFMLYNAEGILLWESEMKTSLVVEKGTWDDKFSVNNGGIVHLRLQFMLSDDERMRIREMRNSAAKRKHEELLKGNHKGEKAGDVAPYVAPGNETGGDSTDECNDQPRNPQMQDPEEHSEHVSAINQAEYNVETAIESNQERVIYGEESFDNQKGNLRSVTSTEAIEESTSSSGDAENPVQSPQKKKLLVSSSTSNVRKMISNFESSVYQGQGQKAGMTTSSISKMDNGGSLKRTVSVESNMKDMSSKTIRKSFSLNMLSDINSQENSKVDRPIRLRKQEQMPKSDDAKLGSSIGAVMNSNLPLEPEVGENVEVLGSKSQMGVKVRDNKNMSVQLPGSAQSIPYERTDDVLKQLMVEDSYNMGRSIVCSNEKTENINQIGNKGGISVASGFDESIKSGKVSDVSRKAVYYSKGTPNETAPLSNNEEPRVLNAAKHPFKGQRSVRFMGIDQSSSKGKSSTSAGARTGLESPLYRNIDGLMAENNPTNGTKSQLSKTKDCDIIVEHATSSNTFLQIIEDKNKILQRNENKNEEECQLSSRPVESVNSYHSCSLWNYENESATGTVWKKSYCSCCIYHLKEQSDSKNSCKSNEQLYETTTFLFGTFGIWVPRHLCITTGSRELRNLVDRCRICLGPLSTEDDFSRRESNDKNGIVQERMFCDSSLELKKTGNISHDFGKLDSEESVGSLLFPGSLFGKIIIIIFACGTLLLRTK